MKMIKLKSTKKRFMFVNFFFFLSLVSCKYECPEFPTEYDKYISFTLNNTISYTDGTDTLNFTVISYYRDEFSSHTSFAPDVDCPYEKYYLTNRLGNLYLYEKYNDYKSLINDNLIMRLSDQDVFSLNTFHVLASTADYLHAEFYDTYTFNDTIELKEVYFLVKDTINQSPKIGYIKKASPGGIIEFYDFQQKKIWKQLF